VTKLWNRVGVCAACRPRRRTLDKLRNEALLAQRPAESETGDSATDYQDA
jgi:hypothetical protein